MTIRENARCQGFPDYYVLVGLAERKGSCTESKGLAGFKASAAHRYTVLQRGVVVMLGCNDVDLLSCCEVEVLPKSG